MFNRIRHWLVRQHHEIMNETDISARLSDDPIRNGLAAERVLNEPIFRAALEHVRQSYLSRFEQTHYGDVEKVKQIHLGLAALKDIQNALLRFRFDGQTAIKAKERLEGISTTNRAFKRTT
jgi:hypothetical protein